LSFLLKFWNFSQQIFHLQTPGKHTWNTMNSNMTSFFRFVNRPAIYRLSIISSMIYFDSDKCKYSSILWLEDGNLYLRLRKMLHTIYTAKFEQTIIHQHVHLRWGKSVACTGACANEIILEF
jgi:hypothetical protein